MVSLQTTVEVDVEKAFALICQEEGRSAAGHLRFLVIAAIKVHEETKK